MVRRYETKGIDAKTIGITVDGKKTVDFQIASDVQAEAVYKSLDYHPGDTYELVDEGRGVLPQKPYEAFRDFLQSVIDGVNDVQPSNLDIVAEVGETSLEDDYADERYLGQADDEDIPF